MRGINAANGAADISLRKHVMITALAINLMPSSAELALMPIESSQSVGRRAAPGLDADGMASSSLPAQLILWRRQPSLRLSQS